MSNEGKLYTLSETLRLLLTQEDRAFGKAVGTHVDSYLEEWEKAPPSENTAQSGSRAHQLHVLVDERMSAMLEERKPSITCRSGCAHCCKMQVVATSAEADLLVRYLAWAGRTLPLDKLAWQAELRGVQEWSAQPEPARTCVFLDTEQQKCTVYPLRPMACRKYLVISPAEQCDIVQHPEGEVGVIFDLDAELLATAAMTHWETGTLPAMLLQSLERQQKEKERQHEKEA